VRMSAALAGHPEHWQASCQWHPANGDSNGKNHQATARSAATTMAANDAAMAPGVTPSCAVRDTRGIRWGLVPTIRARRQLLTKDGLGIRRGPATSARLLAFADGLSGCAGGRRSVPLGGQLPAARLAAHEAAEEGSQGAAAASCYGPNPSQIRAGSLTRWLLSCVIL
jgi:hypothetical protein